MAAQRYLVLRTVNGTRGGSSRGIAERLADAEIQADVLPMTARELGDLQRSPATIRTAPVMPVALVAPLASNARADDDRGCAWGIEAVGALRSPFKGHGVTVGVLDTGIDLEHEAFRGTKIEVKDFTGTGDGDLNGHGTHCAGTFFGRDVDGMRIGVAPGIKRALVAKVLNARGHGSTEQIMDGLLWALREGASVISISIGLDFPGMVRDLVENDGMEIEPATSQALAAYRENVRLFDALADLVKAHGSMNGNAILVASAGNESRRPEYEIATAPPAAADGVISVGALGRTGANGTLAVAAFSNALPLVSAPGVAIRSAKRGGGLAALDGTSMATPHVAGVAALWLEKIRSQNPFANVRVLEGRLIGSARLEGLDPNVDQANAGAGIVQAPLQ